MDVQALCLYAFVDVSCTFEMEARSYVWLNFHFVRDPQASHFSSARLQQVSKLQNWLNTTLPELRVAHRFYTRSCSSVVARCFLLLIFIVVCDGRETKGGNRGRGLGIGPVRARPVHGPGRARSAL